MILTYFSKDYQRYIVSMSDVFLGADDADKLPNPFLFLFFYITSMTHFTILETYSLLHVDDSNIMSSRLYVMFDNFSWLILPIIV